MEQDLDYLKQYVKRQPDHKMAWYFLGKQYEALGKLGKAAYCFMQSGDIYEAYEHKAMPYTVVDSNLDEAEPGSSEPSAEALGKAKRTRRRRRLLMIAMLGLAALWAGGELQQAAPSQERLAGPSASIAPRVYSPPPGTEAALRFRYAEAGRIAEYALQGPGDWKPGEELWVQPERSPDGRWRLWESEPRLLLSLIASPETGQQWTSYLDPELCECEPGEGGLRLEQYAAWQREEEQRVVLRSAVHQFERLNGQVPQSTEDLARPYPNNLLSGITPLMEQQPLTPQASAPLEQEDESPGDALSPEPDKSPGESPEQPIKPVALEPEVPLQAPLEIIVDKANHRLALVSGDMIIRNYPVGLGAERTPEGEFYISEKVKNPNGRSDGDFGSRGMTLSDTLYAIHGTNEPESIGKDESLGCVRMEKDDLEELFAMTPQGTKVTISKNVLPDSIMRPKERFVLPGLVNETNPLKVYRWL